MLSFWYTGGVTTNPMMIFLSGKDRFRLMRRRSELKQAFREECPEGETVSVDAAEDPLRAAKRLADAGAVDLFGATRFVDVGGAFSVADDEKERICDTLKGAVDSSRFLFVSDGSVKAKDPLAAFLKKHADITEEFPILSAEEARTFLTQEARTVSADVSFSRSAADRLIALFPGDSGTLSGYARTLTSYRESGEVSLEDVERFVSGNPREKVFAALDALVSGDRGKAATMLLEESRADSGGVPKLFGLLAWQLRELLKVRGECDRGVMRSADIAKATGMHPFVVGKLLSRMSGFSLARLRDGFSLLASLDSDLKVGRIDPELALTLFVKKF